MSLVPNAVLPDPWVITWAGDMKKKKNSHGALIWRARLCYLSSPNALERSSISFIVPNLHLHSGCPSGDYSSQYVAPTQRNVCNTNTEYHKKYGAPSTRTNLSNGIFFYDDSKGCTTKDSDLQLSQVCCLPPGFKMPIL
jgi:hypothetical protein